MKYNKIFRKRNLLYIVLIVFGIWMLFFDSNSFIEQFKYKSEIKELEKSVDFYEEGIHKNKTIIKELSIQKNLNEFAREEYNYKKENETIYLIEYDTID